MDILDDRKLFEKEIIEIKVNLENEIPNLTNVCLLTMKIINGWKNIPLPENERNNSKENYILNKLWHALILTDEIDIAYCYYHKFFYDNRCLKDYIIISEMDENCIEFNMILSIEELNCNADGLKIKIPEKSVLNNILIELKIKSNTIEVFPNHIIFDKVASFGFPFNDVLNENINPKDLPNYIVSKKSNVGFFFKKLNNLKGIFEEYHKMITSGLKKNLSNENLYFMISIEKINNNLLLGKLLIENQFENNQLPKNIIFIEDLNELFLMNKSEIIDFLLEINDGWVIWQNIPFSVKLNLIYRGFKAKSYFILKKTIEDNENCNLKLKINLRKSKKVKEEIIDLRKRCLNDQSNYALGLMNKTELLLEVENATLHIPNDSLPKGVIPSLCIHEYEENNTNNTNDMAMKNKDAKSITLFLKCLPNNVLFKKSALLSLKTSSCSPKIITSMNGSVIDYKCEENSSDITIDIGYLNTLTIRDGIIIFGHVVGIPLENDGTIIDVYLARKNIFAPKVCV